MRYVVQSVVKTHADKGDCRLNGGPIARLRLFQNKGKGLNETNDRRFIGRQFSLQSISTKSNTNKTELKVLYLNLLINTGMQYYFQKTHKTSRDKFILSRLQNVKILFFILYFY